MIDTRVELIGALREAAEIEHGLMIQYLFPALTMKKRLDEGLTGPQQRANRAWEATILGVAVEEMGHLGTVCNLLAAVGAAPHFGRPNFPQQVGYYPFPFDLVPFGDEALYRMLVFELPQGEPLPIPPVLDQADEALAMLRSVAPDPLEYTYVGELYGQIADGFRTLDPATLFIGPRQAQVDNDWSVELDMHAMDDTNLQRRRDQALAAIDDIILDGEGASAQRATSHFGRFSAVRRAYTDSGRFPAARPVVRNPQTRDQPGADPGTVLTDELSLRTAELFNSTYAVVLTLLAHFFTLGPETAEQRNALRTTASRLMSVAVRPIAEVLTELPAFGPGTPDRAGPPFELYDQIELSPFPDARWTMQLENLAAIAAEAAELGVTVPRLAAIGQTIGYARRSLAAVAP
jgi:ferritin-like protein